MDNSGNIRHKSGAVIVPYYQKNDQLYVGLITMIRERVINPETGNQGSLVIELPSGFGDLGDSSSLETAKRELGEETGKFALRVTKLGDVNPNTAFYVAPSAAVFAIMVDPVGVDYAARFNNKEPILKCKFYPYSAVHEMVYKQKISCGFTLSGLQLFDIALKYQPLLRNY